MGIETCYSSYSPADERRIKELAKKYSLLQSGGSDFHGENKPGLDLANGYGRLYVPEKFLDALKGALKTKILFTDLDGTLLTSDKTISERTRARLLDMIREGYSLALASGRPLESILEVLDRLDIKEEVGKMQADGAGGIYITAYNGAMLYDCMKDELISESCVSAEAVQRIFDMARERGIHVHTYADGARIVSIAEDKELAYYRQYIHLPYAVTERPKEFLSHEAYKLVAIDLENRERLEDFRRAVEASELGEGLTCAFSNNSYLEIYNKDAGKGNALIKLCRELNILIRNAAAAGDEENDISMIEAAGTGAAMANAGPKLKACADYVTKWDNDNDGIAEIIDLFVFGLEERGL